MSGYGIPHASSGNNHGFGWGPPQCQGYASSQGPQGYQGPLGDHDNDPHRDPNDLIPDGPPVNGLETRVTIKGFETRRLAFRRLAQYLALFQTLQVETYCAFENHPNEYRLHFHLLSDTECLPEHLLDAVQYDAGRYFVGNDPTGAGVQFYAHFMRRDVSLGIMGIVPADAHRAMGNCEGMGSGRVIGGAASNFQPSFSPASSYPAMGSTFTRQQDSSKAQKSRLNPHSTTVYPMTPPMPAERYDTNPYFTGPSVFIPIPAPKPRRVIGRPAAEPFPGFQCSVLREPSVDLQAFDAALAQEQESRGMGCFSVETEGRFGSESPLDADKEEAFWAEQGEEKSFGLVGPEGGGDVARAGKVGER